MVDNMKDRFKIVPKRVARGRKIQVRQFEPEELWIEYEIEVSEPSAAEEAVLEATRLAREYLDNQEKILRGVKDTPVNSIVTSKIPSVTEYQLELINKGKNQLHIKKSDDPKFVNFIHLWFDKKHYVGYLRKDTGKFVTKDQKIAQKHGIKEGTHFRIITRQKMATA